MLDLKKIIFSIFFAVILLFTENTSFAYFNFHIAHPGDTDTSSSSSTLAATSSTTATTSSPWFVSSIEDRVVNFVHSTVNTLHYSHYKLGGTHFDVSRGVYVVDCSSYVDHVLRTVCPRAYDSLAVSTGSDKPTTKDYYQFFTKLSSAPRHYWSKVADVKSLEPGDILVFRTESIHRSRHHHRQIVAGAGHVMIVMSKPIFETDAFLVRVADSASAGHGDDTRSPHVSGIGIGTLLLKVNPRTGVPYAYAWNFSSYWKNNVKFAMARPKDVG